MADEFEEKYLPGTGQVYARGKLRSPVKLFAAALVPAAIAVWFTPMPLWAKGVMSAAMVGLGFFGNVALSGVRTVVSAGCLEVWVGVRRALSVSLDEIAQVEVVDIRFREFLFGRGHVRRGTGGTGFLPLLPFGGPKRGVAIHTTGGKRYVIAEQQAEALAEGLRQAMAATGPRVRVATTEPALEWIEAEAEGMVAEQEREVGG